MNGLRRTPGACHLRLVLLAATVVLAACHAPPRASSGAPARGRVLNLYSWSEYFPSPVLRQFEAETGIKVNYSVLDSNDVVETTLSAGHSGFDLVTVNAAPHLGRQIPRGLWLPLDKTRLRNLKNVDSKILEMLARVDPGNRYAIPYMWGTIGLIYNRDKIAAIDALAPVDSLDMIFRPQLARRFAPCGISVLGSWVDMLPLLAEYLGQHDLPADPDSVARVAATFDQVRPYIRRITTSGYYDQLARGELCLSIGYSADAVAARRRAEELGSGVHIEFRQARETVPMYIDAFAIPVDATNVEEALELIDFTLRPEVGEALAHATGFAIANAAAAARLDPDPVVYPPPEVRARFTLVRGYSMAETRALSRTWLKMKTGY